MFPVGLRYHALHHLFPFLPYHNLGKAHARLIARLPAGSPYHAVNCHSYFVAVAISGTAPAERHRRTSAITLWRQRKAPHLSLAVAGGVTAAPDAAARPWLIVNPHSFRASRTRPGRTDRCPCPQPWPACHRGPRSRRIPHCPRPVARPLRRADLDAAGDGTVHATAQYLARPASAGWSPALLLLGGGRAKRRAAGLRRISTRQRFGAALEALREGRSLAEERLLTLRIEQEGAEAQHGFFLAGAVIYAGIRLCRNIAPRAAAGCIAAGSLIHTAVESGDPGLGRRSPLPPYGRPAGTHGWRCCDACTDADAAGLDTAVPGSALQSVCGARRGCSAPYGCGSVCQHFWRHLPAMFRGAVQRQHDIAAGISERPVCLCRGAGHERIRSGR